MNIEAKLSRLPFFECFYNVIKQVERVFHDFSNSWANGTVAFSFMIVGLIIQMIIQLLATKLIDFEVKDWNSIQ